MATPVEVNSRFVANIRDEPKKMLLPISGYEDEPLLPLEQACQPLETILNKELKQNLIIAKMNSKNSKDGLTPDESASIHLYTMEWKQRENSLYAVLNRTLREADRNKLRPWFKYLKLFLTAFFKLPSTEYQTVWRGVPEDLSDLYPNGEEQAWWSLSSCTSSIGVLESPFYLGKSGTRTMFSIETRRGKLIRSHSYFQNEDEILLPPGTFLKVVGTLNLGDGLHIIHLREILPPYQMLAEPFDRSQLQQAFRPSQPLSAEKDSPKPKAAPTTSVPQVSKAGPPLRSANIRLGAKWVQNGVTVAGGNGQGSELNQLSYPYSVCLDDDATIYIAERDNHRIVKWKCGAKSGQVVAGGNGKGKRNDQFDCPTDVIVDKKNDCLIICDWGNRRVVRWPRQGGIGGETIVSGIDCERLAMDNEGFLYVSSPTEYAVRRWRSEENSIETVAGGNGRGDRLDQLNWPTFIFVDQDNSLYVSEWNNNRVMKWMKGAKEGIVVAGGHKCGNDLTQLHRPAGLVVDQLGTVYVADHGNNRVIRWPKGEKKGRIVVGGNGQGEQGNQLDRPEGLSFNPRGDLYVVDRGNCRVQRFLIEKTFCCFLFAIERDVQ